MYRVVVWGLSDIFMSAVYCSLSSAVDALSCFEYHDEAIGGAIYRADSEGKAKELIRFFDFA